MIPEEAAFLGELKALLAKYHCRIAPSTRLRWLRDDEGREVRVYDDVLAIRGPDVYLDLETLAKEII